MSLLDIKKSVRNIPDFPIPGIQFKDISPVLNDPDLLSECIGLLADNYKHAGITKVVGIESRGFILGGAIANQLNAGFVPVRKPGKLPYEKKSKNYELEYGTNTIEIHIDALNSDDIVLLHDDLLATGGTARAALELIRSFGVKKVYSCFIIELGFLKGRKLLENSEPFSLINFES